MVLVCAAFFLGASLLYFLRTRRYLFPVLCLNFAYFSERFVSVQDGLVLDHALLQAKRRSHVGSRGAAGRWLCYSGAGSTSPAHGCAPGAPGVSMRHAPVLAVATAASLATTLLLQGLVVAGAAQTDPAFEALTRLVTGKMTEHDVPGVAFGIVKDGRVFARGFGVGSVDAPQPVTADTLFPIASISKTVTATAIMRLVEDGRMDLDAPVRRYLPDFAVGDDETSRNVRIWHLLTHTPGWEGQLSTPDRGAETLEAFAASLRDLPQLAPAGSVWSYNNAAFTLAGRIIEVVTGESIHDAVDTLVFEPLGLTRAVTRLEDVVTWPLTVGHRRRGGTTSVIRPLIHSSSVTAGGVWMSLSDLLAYGAFHLGDGTAPDGQRVLSEASLEAMQTARVPKAGTDDAMGLGWHLRRVDGVPTAAHGGTLGHTLLLELVPERNLAFAILTNSTNGWRLIQDVERATLEQLEGLTLDPAQALGHRGVNETMPDAPILATQPDPAPYVGTFSRPPQRGYTVRVEDGRLMVNNSSIAFYANDRAVVTSGNQRGNPVEFIRRDDGTIGWIRMVGRIARKANDAPFTTSTTIPRLSSRARAASRFIGAAADQRRTCTSALPRGTRSYGESVDRATVRTTRAAPCPRSVIRTAVTQRYLCGCPTLARGSHSC